MVKIGFIVEGKTEKVLVQSKEFQDWCSTVGIEIVEPVVDAGGSGNLLPQNMKNYLIAIRKNNPVKIVVLTDSEEEPSVDKIRNRIVPSAASSGLDFVFIAVKAVEAWFLADSVALAKWLKEDNYVEPEPEKTVGMPWDRLKELAQIRGIRSPGSSKPAFAKRFIKKNGFSIERAANHPHCPSAKELHDTLCTWGQG